MDWARKGFLFVGGMIIALIVICAGASFAGLFVLTAGIKNSLIAGALFSAYVAFRCMYGRVILKTKKSKRLFFSIAGILLLFLALVPVGC